MDAQQPQKPSPSPQDSILGSLEKRTGSSIRVQLVTSGDVKTPVI